MTISTSSRSLELAGLSRDTPGLQPLNQYKFNGKEFQTDLGLNWNHQDWRFVDLARGPVWHGVDPLSDEGQENWSPYAYNFGNAVRFSDPDGQAPGDGWALVTAAADFTNGFLNGLVSNATTLPNGAHAPGLGRVSGNEYVAAGQAAADLVSVVQGAGEFLAGGTVATGGTLGGVLTAPTGLGAVAGAAVAVGGVAVAGHGLNTMNNGMKNLLNGNNGRVYARPANRTASNTHGNSSASTKPTGSYEIKFNNGKTYNGVGPKSRMNSSAKRLNAKHPTGGVESAVHTPAPDRKTAEIAEFLGLKANGGLKNEARNYNQANSPGRKHVEGK